jgi:hypothetical protein
LVIAARVIATDTGCRPFRNFGSSLALILAAAGAIALFDGFSTAVLEESRARYGQVVSGVVEERLSSTGESGTRTIGGRGTFRRGPTVRTSGFDVYESLTRALLRGSFDAWVIDYRYPCLVSGGRCRGRDFVSHDSGCDWRRQDGQRPAIKGRNQDRAFDENSQRKPALVRPRSRASHLRWPA